MSICNESFAITIHNDLLRPLINIDNYDVESNLPTPNMNSYKDPIFKDKEIIESFLELQRLSIKIQFVINSICYRFIKK
jgi:hypothetical protein